VWPQRLLALQHGGDVVWWYRVDRGSGTLDGSRGYAMLGG